MRFTAQHTCSAKPSWGGSHPGCFPFFVSAASQGIRFAHSLFVRFAYAPLTASQKQACARFPSRCALACPRARKKEKPVGSSNNSFHVLLLSDVTFRLLCSDVRTKDALLSRHAFTVSATLFILARRANCPECQGRLPVRATLTTTYEVTMKLNTVIAAGLWFWIFLVLVLGDLPECFAFQYYTTMPWACNL